MELPLEQWADTLQQTALRTWEDTGELESVYVNVWRNDEPVYTFLCDDRDSALAVMHVACVGMAADGVAISFEGWTTTMETNPDTGNEWAQGDLTKYVEEHGDTGEVGTAIFTHVVTRGHEQTSRAYRVTRLEDGIDVLDMYPPERRSSKPVGSMGDWMMTSMMEPSLEERIEELGTTVEEINKAVGGAQRRLTYQDQASISKLVKQGALRAIIYVSVKDSERDKALQEIMGEAAQDQITHITPEEFLKKFEK